MALEALLRAPVADFVEGVGAADFLAGDFFAGDFCFVVMVGYCPVTEILTIR